MGGMSLQGIVGVVGVLYVQDVVWVTIDNCVVEV